MQDFINIVFSPFGGVAAVATAALTWLLSVWKGHIHRKEKAKLDMVMEELKASLSKKTQLLEHELQIERHAAQLGHAKLIEKRASVIETNYQLLVELHQSIYETFRPDYFARPMPSLEEAYATALIKFDIFMENFEKNRIFFSKEVTKKVSDLYVLSAQSLDKARVVMHSGESFESGNSTPHLQELFNHVLGNMERAKAEIEGEFRIILRTEEV